MDTANISEIKLDTGNGNGAQVLGEDFDLSEYLTPELEQTSLEEIIATLNV